MNTYLEITPDHGAALRFYASDNSATYILTSARAHDAVTLYREKYGRCPSSRWYRRHFCFERIK